MRHKKKDISQIFRERTPILRALERAALEAIQAHDKAGLPVVVYRKGRATLVPARELLRSKAG